MTGWRERTPPGRLRQYGAAASGLFYFLPVLVLYGVALIVPLVITIQNSVALGGSGWQKVFHGALFVHASINTIVYSLVITIVTIPLAYALAAAIWRSGSVGRIIFTSATLLAFWMPVLVKVVSWNALLRNNGVLNSFLLSSGLIHEPLQLFPGSPAVVLGMIQFVLPFAVFPIVAVMLRLDRNLELAAESLGSTPLRVFRHVVLPLTLPGAIAASLLVFVICLGFYVIPATLGAPGDLMLANVIAIYALQLVDFRVASAIAVLLLVVVAALTYLYQYADRRPQ